jgi:hypothetical protein
MRPVLRINVAERASRSQTPSRALALDWSHMPLRFSPCTGSKLNSRSL